MAISWTMDSDDDILESEESRGERDVDQLESDVLAEFVPLFARLGVKSWRPLTQALPAFMAERCVSKGPVDLSPSRSRSGELNAPTTNCEKQPRGAFHSLVFRTVRVRMREVGGNSPISQRIRVTDALT